MIGTLSIDPRSIKPLPSTASMKRGSAVTSGTLIKLCVAAQVPTSPTPRAAVTGGSLRGISQPRNPRSAWYSHSVDNSAPNSDCAVSTISASTDSRSKCDISFCISATMRSSGKPPFSSTARANIVCGCFCDDLVHPDPKVGELRQAAAKSTLAVGGSKSGGRGGSSCGRPIAVWSCATVGTIPRILGIRQRRICQAAHRPTATRRAISPSF